MPMPLSGGRSNYNPLSSTDVEEEDVTITSTRYDAVDSMSDRRTSYNGDDLRSLDQSSIAPKSKQNAREEPLDNQGDSRYDQHETGERIQIIILDSAQHRFPVDANPDWSVETLKKEGEKIHRVPPSSQRLIFRGKMLADSCVLRDAGIDKGDIILHLVSQILPTIPVAYCLFLIHACFSLFSSPSLEWSSLHPVLRVRRIVV